MVSALDGLAREMLEDAPHPAAVVRVALPYSAVAPREHRHDVADRKLASQPRHEPLRQVEGSLGELTDRTNSVAEREGRVEAVAQSPERRLRKHLSGRLGSIARGRLVHHKA